jgi:long-subunit acyl-CoA synthetase (AMP-forming)
MSNVFDKSGFYKSGDLGSISAKGEISIHGRANQDGT